jgi:TolA-binding protein
MEKVSKSKNIQELAQGYYKLGIANTYLFDMARAEKAFKNVMELVPGTELAKKAQFNLGWTYKFSGKYNDASATFSRFIAEYPNDKLAQDAKYQLANSYYKAGKFEEAARNYAELGKAFPGSQLASLAQFQAGYTLLYDLHKPLEAAEAFGELKKKYQNSAFADYVDTGVVSVIDRSYRYY